MNLMLLVDKGLNFVPKRQAWIEASGYVLIGIGFILGLATYSYNPSDYTYGRALVASADHIRNAAGPVGAYISRELLGRFGVVGLAWPAAFVAWGLMVVFGFLVFPTAKRIIGFLGLTVVGSAFAEVQLYHLGISRPAFGYGGIIGKKLGIPLEMYMGYAGALVVLAVAASVILSLTGNITISATSQKVQTGRYHFVRGIRRFFKLMLEFKRREDQRIASYKEKLEAQDNPFQYFSPQAGNAAPRKRESQKDKEASAGGIAEKSAATPKSSDDAAAGDGKNASKPSTTFDFYYTGPNFDHPDPRLFKGSEAAPKRAKSFHTDMAARLTSQLQEFKVEGKVTNVTEGPVVTTFEFEPAPGTKVSKITNLSEDLARLLEARSLRILAPIPGKKTLGFEVPNEQARMIGFGDLLAADEFRSRKLALPIAMGLDAFGAPLVTDLTTMPHLLVAGSTGSGKSVFMNSLIASLITRHSAKDLRLIMIDPKMVEMAAYNGIPHMACPVITDPQNEALKALNALVYEMDQRFELMRALGAKNISGFNQIIRSHKKTDFVKFEGRWATLPYIVLIIDELADMMMVLGKEVETPITRLAQKARAAGIHLVIATQRPSAEVVTGLIKANFPTRVAFRVLSGIDSRTILDSSGAETLLGKGDMLYLSEKGLQRLHGAYLSDEEVAKMVKYCKRRK